METTGQNQQNHGHHCGRAGALPAASPHRLPADVMRWTAPARRWQMQGWKQCGKCGECLPIQCFAPTKTKHGNLSYFHACRVCIRERNRTYSARWRAKLEAITPQEPRPPAPPEPPSPSKKSQERRQTHLKYKKAQREEILAQDTCDICGEPGAQYFWRNLSKGYFHSLVFHQHCEHLAKEDELLPKQARIRHKDTLIGEDDNG